MPRRDSITGLITRMVRSSLLGARLAGGFWFDDVPPSKVLPFGSMRWVRSRFQWMFETTYIFGPQLRVELFAVNKPDRAEELGQDFLDLLAWNNISGLTESRSFKIEPLDFFVESAPEYARDGRKAYRCVIPLDVGVVRELRSLS